MFTIIIPLYNKALYVAKAIQSVATQTYQNFELIIVNDGSTDNSLEVLEKYDFKNIDVKILNQENSGVSSARNNGVKQAKYDYIAFLDADDWWEPEYLQEMCLLIQKYPDAGLWATKYNIVKNGRIKDPNIVLDSDFNDDYIDYFKTYFNSFGMPVWTGATIIKKSVFNEMNGFKQNLKLGEDFDLWIRISLINKIAFLNKSLSNYNQDVDVNNRAIGLKFYNPNEHFLFQNYGEVHSNPDFVFLYEKLVLYGLFPYFIFNKNTGEVLKIIKTIHWKNYPYIWYVKYKIIPKFIHRIWLRFIISVVNIKKLLT